jgi:large subunit ribosomal protein L22
MEVIAKLNFLRQSPRKVKLIIDEIRGLDLVRAEQQLSAMVRQAAKPVLKLVKSAAANAVNNNKLDRAALYVKSVMVAQGPVLKRYHPHAFGRASTVRKPTCHITVVLAERSGKIIKSSRAAKVKNNKPDNN